MWLAETLGMTRRQLLRNIDSREWTDWYAYYRVKNEKQEKAAKRAELDARHPKKLARKR